MCVSVMDKTPTHALFTEHIIELKNARWNNEIRKCPTSKTLQRLQKHQAEATENKCVSVFIYLYIYICGFYNVWVFW